MCIVRSTCAYWLHDSLASGIVTATMSSATTIAFGQTNRRPRRL